MLEKKELTEFIKKTFPNITSALLTGSHGKKHKTNNSDIDIILFSNHISKSFVEKVQIENIKYDFIYLSTSYQILIRELYYDLDSRVAIYYNMFSNSEILFDNNNHLKNLLNFCEKVAIKEYRNLNSKEIEFKIKTISNALEDLEDIHDDGEFVFTSSFILEETTNLIFPYNSISLGRGKIKARQLKKIYPDFYSNIVTCVKAGNKKDFIKLIKEKIDFFGGIKDQYTSKNISSFNFNNEFYEIYIPKKYAQNFYTQTLKIIDKNLTHLNCLLNFYFYVDDQLIIRFTCGKWSNHLHSLIVRNLKKILNIKASEYIYIKNQKTKLLPFCNNRTNEVLEKDLMTLRKNLLRNKIVLKNRIDKLAFVNTILIEATEKIFKEHKIQFLENISENNNYEIFDLELNYSNYFQLAEKFLAEKNNLLKLGNVLKKHKILDINLDNLFFLDHLLKLENEDLEILSTNYFDSNFKFLNSKCLLLNLYVKYMTNLFDEYNYLGLSSFILKENYYEEK